MGYANLNWNVNREMKEKFLLGLAPVAIFTYKRFEHTKRTIEALLENVYAKDTIVYIFSDGPRNKEDVNDIEKVRAYLHKIKGFKSVIIIEREKNIGLAKNIIDGVTRIVNKHGKIIVVEDDIVTSKYFLMFMNDALELYKNDERIMEVSGYMHPIKTDDLDEVYFIKESFCWGWGTWKRSWKYFKKNTDELIRTFTDEDIYKFNMDGSTGEWKEVLLNHEGKIDTWAVFWGISMFLQDGLCVVSKIPLSENIGFDGSGVHKVTDKTFAIPVVNKKVNNFPVGDEIIECKMARERIKRFFETI